jgi:hypothetical protein
MSRDHLGSLYNTLALHQDIFACPSLKFLAMDTNSFENAVNFLSNCPRLRRSDLRLPDELMHGKWAGASLADEDRLCSLIWNERFTVKVNLVSMIQCME